MWSSWRNLGSWILLCGGFVAGCGGDPRLALDPIPLQDDDKYDIPAPKVRVRDDYYDLIDHTFFKPTEQLFDVPRDARKVAGKPKQALNATPLDEVQDSSWFTNRIGRRRLTTDEVRQGPNRPLGPDLDNPLTIVAGKTQGVTPGFTIQDSHGDRYVIKFDPKDSPELATGANAIATRILWTAGFNVTEDYLVTLDVSKLSISPKATVKLELGKKRPLTDNDLQLILSKAPRQPDGSIRVIASRFLKGTPLGPIPFIGVRGDDPNDVIRHEHRRELRGYKVFCSWLNHNDCREINSLDMFVEEEGRHFVKHYILDLNATLGSASIQPNLKSEGFEMLVDLGEMGTSLASFGLAERPWLDFDYPRLRGIGRFEALHFDPEHWKPNYPAPPFENTTGRDGFWAAKLIARFDDETLRAIVESAEFTDPKSTEYMIRALAERRDRIARYWFGRVNPLDEFELVRGPSAAYGKAAAGAGGGLMSQVLGAAKAGGPAGEPALRFTDLAVQHELVAPRRYTVRIEGPDGHIVQETATDAREIPLTEALRALGTPASDDPAARLLRVDLRSAQPDGKGWTQRVRVTLYQPVNGTLRIASIERDE